MNKFKFVVSDETLNSQGFIVKTAGINISKFKQNPIMLYMHDRGQVIGRWDNIKVENNRLVADAVFDEGIELGAKIKHQVEERFLRCASIGIEEVKYETINGIQTVLECNLFEISIVDISANQNAVRLYAKGRKPVLKLSQVEGEKPSIPLRTRIIDILGINDHATDEDIISTIKEIMQTSENVEREVKEAVLHGIVDAGEEETFLLMAKNNVKAFRKYCSNKKLLQSKEIEHLLSKNRNKILPYNDFIYKKIGDRMGVHVLREVLETMPTPIRFTDMIRKVNYVPKSMWTLDDYRKYAPEDLRNNPALLKKLLSDSENKCNITKDLDYYRKYDPEFLKENPEIYEQLLSKK